MNAWHHTIDRQHAYLDDLEAWLDDSERADIPPAPDLPHPSCLPAASTTEVRALEALEDRHRGITARLRAAMDEAARELGDVSTRRRAGRAYARQGGR